MATEAAEAEAGPEVEPEVITWEVKKVIDKRRNPVTGDIEYLLEWKNWDGPPTWEPQFNCDCKALIRKYEKQLKPTPVRGRNSLARASKTKTTPPPRPPEFIDLATSSKSSSSSTSSSSASLSATSSTSDSSDSETTALRKRSRKNKDLAVERFEREPSQPSKGRRNRPSSSAIKTKNPRSKTPDAQELCCDSSCSEAGSILDPQDNEDWVRIIKRRKLILKEIVGAVNEKEILFIVKWHGIAQLEKVPLQLLRKFHSQDILDFFLKNLNWKNST